MKILFLIKAPLESFPPIISQIRLALNAGYDVEIVALSCSPALKENLIKYGVSINLINVKTIRYKILNKIYQWIISRNQFKRVLKNRDKDNTIVYVCTETTAIITTGLLQSFKSIVHIMELHDDKPRIIKALRRAVKEADVVIVPELCRAHILKVWLSLDKLPLVIPNRIHFHPQKRNLNISCDSHRKKISELKNKKIIIYQGLIDKERDLTNIAKALAKLENEEFVLVLLGVDKNNTVDYLKSILPGLVYLGYIPDPDYMMITSHAYIGLVNYDDSNLNHIFCAPNKIYEYAGYGIPTLARNIPGLEFTIGRFEAGICVDFKFDENIINALKKIDNEYEYYSKKALKFYNSVDTKYLFEKMILEATNGK